MQKLQLKPEQTFKSLYLFFRGVHTGSCIQAWGAFVLAANSIENPLAILHIENQAGNWIHQECNLSFHCTVYQGVEPSVTTQHVGNSPCLHSLLLLQARDPLGSLCTCTHGLTRGKFYGTGRMSLKLQKQHKTALFVRTHPSFACLTHSMLSWCNWKQPSSL